MNQTEITLNPEGECLHEVRIHIDRLPHRSPDPTSGEALYRLGQVPPGHQLYREVHGDQEDEPIFRDLEKIHLREDEHFYSADHLFKGYDIFVNARPRLVQKRELCFNEIVDLAFATPPSGPYISFTITFCNAAGKIHEGTLAKGHCVKIKNGTSFNVKVTDRS